MLGRNNENCSRPGKEVTGKLGTGPTMRRAALGDIGNKATLLQRSVSVDAKAMGGTKPTLGFKKPVLVSKAKPMKRTVQAQQKQITE